MPPKLGLENSSNTPVNIRYGHLYEQNPFLTINALTHTIDEIRNTIY